MCLRWYLVLEDEPKSSSNYRSDIRQVSYRYKGFLSFLDK